MRWATHSNYKRRARRRRAERAITHVSPTLPVPPLSWHSRHRAVPAPLALTLHLAQARCSAARARLRDQTAVAQPGSSPGGWRGAIWSMHKPRDGTMHSASAKKRGPRKRRARVKLSRTEREEGEDSGLQASGILSRVATYGPGCGREEELLLASSPRSALRLRRRPADSSGIDLTLTRSGRERTTSSNSM